MLCSSIHAQNKKQTLECDSAILIYINERIFHEVGVS